MLPWETLRRLLGLPADMAPPSALELTQMAIHEPRRARLIAMVLVGHTPKEAPVALVLGALERGTLDTDLAMELLGAIGHGAGYPAAKTMLWEDETGARVAGVAMAQILGRRAVADLSLCLRLAPERPSREGAALGLTEIGDAEIAVTLAEAGCDGHIRARVAARCVIRLPIEAQSWMLYLTADELDRRRFGTEVIYAFLLSDGVEARAALAALGEVGREAVQRSLDDEELYMLPDKREALAAWARPSS